MAAKEKACKKKDWKPTDNVNSMFSVLSKDVDENYEDVNGMELSLINLGFSVSKYINFDGIKLPEKTSLQKALENRLLNYIQPDCVVKIGGKIEYRCHLLVLQCYSKFFDKKDSTKAIEIPAEHVSCQIFELVYSWMLADKGDCYTMIRRDQIADLLIAARFFEISELEEQCMDAIKCERLFKEGTAFVLYIFARDRGLQEIQDMMVPRIRTFFPTIVCSTDFLDDFDVHDVTTFLASDYISVHNELEVYMIAMRWLRHEWPTRKEHVRSVLSCVRFGLIPAHHLVNIRRHNFHHSFVEIMKSDPYVPKMVDDGVAYSITKGWQAGEGEEFDNSLVQQGLVKPKPRNFTQGEFDASYESYEGWLKELARRRHVTKTSHGRKLGSWSNSSFGSDIVQGDEETVELSLAEMGFKVNKILDWKVVENIREKSNNYVIMKERLRNYIHTDFKVQVGEDVEFNTHLLLLQCYSLKCNNIPNKNRLVLPSEQVTAKGFELTYQWMLAEPENAHGVLRRDVLLDIYATAKYLEIKELINLCWTTISNTKLFYDGTAFLLYLMAKERFMPEVQNLMAPRIGKFFLTLVSSRDFLELDLEDICAFLSSDNICVHSEIEVFMSAVRWLKAEWRERKVHTTKVMSCVRFGLIPAWQLVDIRRNPENPEFLEVTSLPEVDKMIDNGLACSIVKEWYSEGSEKYLQCIADQGLQLPAYRNWYDLKKDYITYRDFLRDLNSRRKGNFDDRMSTTSQIPSAIRPEPLEFNDIDTPRLEKTISSVQPTPKPIETGNNIEMAHGDGLPDRNRNLLRVQTSFDPTSMFRVITSRDALTPNSACPSANTRINTERNQEDNASDISERPSMDRMIGPAQKKAISLTSPDEESILIFGGTDPFQKLGERRNSGRNIIKLNPTTSSWEVVGDLPYPRHHHCAAVFRNRVFIIGGTDPSQKDEKGRSVVVGTVWSLDIKNRIWFREADLLTARKDAGIVEAGGKLWILGGRDRFGKVLRSVEKYDHRSRKWTEGPPMNVSRYGMGVAFHESSIWVAGGTSKTNDTSTVERLYFSKDQCIDKWVQQGSLRYPRSFCSLASVLGELYLLGGVSGSNSERSSVSDVDVLSNGEWKLRFALPLGRHCQSVAVADSQMFIIGGVSTRYQSCLTDVQTYCCRRKGFLKVTRNLPFPLSGHAAVVLRKE